MSVVWSHATDVKGTELLVLLSLADHSQDDGSSFPSVGRIAARARTTDRNVQYALVKLESKGWVTRHQRGGRSTVYQLDVPESARGRGDEDGFGVQSLRGEAQGVKGVKPSSPITVREPTTHRGGVVEVPQEQVHPEEPAPPQNSVTERPFPEFAKAALGSVTEEQAAEWTAAWRTAWEVGREWDPLGNLTKYLARCKDRKTSPSPTEWTRWFVEDEHKARQFAREAAASTTEETPHHWWE